MKEPWNPSPAWLLLIALPCLGLGLYGTLKGRALLTGMETRARVTRRWEEPRSTYMGKGRAPVTGTGLGLELEYEDEGGARHVHRMVLPEDRRGFWNGLESASLTYAPGHPDWAYVKAAGESPHDPSSGFLLAVGGIGLLLAAGSGILRRRGA